MGLFYKITRQKLFKVKNEIFVKHGLPTLLANGFEQSPFYGHWFGKHQPGLYGYELCRLNARSNLECITVYISSGDRWIQVFLNIFELKPHLTSLAQLKGVDVIQFAMIPNVKSRMRLRIDDFDGIPLFRNIEHKLKSYYTESGFQQRVIELGELLETDLTNIHTFVNRWYELHEPLATDWEGKAIVNP